LQPETWLHEAGIASNRISSQYGEYFLIRVHTARQAPKVGLDGIYLDKFLLFLYTILRFFFSFFLVKFIGKDMRAGYGC